MAVNVLPSNKLPSDAVVLNELDAAVHAWDLVNEWNKFSEVWALRYGPNALGVLSATCGLIINKHYRHKLKVGRYGYVSSFLPIVIIPGSLTLIFHKFVVSNKILLQRAESCAICHEVRSAAVQIGVGIIYPMLLAPVTSLMLANRYSTYRLPSISAEPKELFQVTKKLTKPLTGTLGYMLAFNLIFSSIITYYELQNVASIRREIREIEKRLEAENIKFE